MEKNLGFDKANLVFDKANLAFDKANLAFDGFPIKTRFFSRARGFYSTVFLQLNHKITVPKAFKIAKLLFSV